MLTQKPEPDWARQAGHPRLTKWVSIERSERRLEPAAFEQPQAYLHIQVNGRETSYFEWLGAGVYCPRSNGTARGRQVRALRELRYGFDDRFFYLRVDLLTDLFSTISGAEFRIVLRGNEELRLLVAIEAGKVAGSLLDTEDICILGPHELVCAAFDKILEVSIGRRLVGVARLASLMLEVELWHDGFLLDVLPAEGSIEVKLGPDAFAWPTA
jgi:hypothetical protein